jgi:tetratricopeptide (TPR) repeat protein
MVNVVLASMGQADPSSSWKAAEAAALRATQEDPLLGNAHVALGMVNLFFHWDIDAAYQHIQKGIGLSPGSAAARNSFGMYLLVVGEPDRAVEEMELAVRLDPRSPTAFCKSNRAFAPPTTPKVTSSSRWAGWKKPRACSSAWWRSQAIRTRG